MEYKRVRNDAYGNPRYVVHYLSLGLTEYEDLKPLLKKYRGKDFGGGYVFVSYEPEKFLKEIKKEIQKRGRVVLMNMETIEERIKQIEEDSSFKGTDVELSSIIEDGGAFVYRDMVYAVLPTYDEDTLMATCRFIDVVDYLDHALTDKDFLKFSDTSEELYREHPELFLYDYIAYYGIHMHAYSLKSFLFDYITD